MHFVTFLFAAVYIIAALAPYLNPVRWWLVAILGLTFPYFLLALIALTVFWLLFRRRTALFLMLVMLLGWKSISVVFSFHLPHRFGYKKSSGTLRIASWNVARFIEIRENNNKGSQTRTKMMELLREQNADILCLQEFHDATRPGFYHNIDYIEEELGYPYHYYLYDPDGYHLYYGSVIFSRMPILKTGYVRYPRPTLPDALLYADILHNNDTVRIYTTHLQSVMLRKNELETIENIETPDDRLIQNSRPILGKLKTGFKSRSIQAGIIRGVLDKSPYPALLCADFNDVPNSYTYFTIKGNMQDAFLKKGSGFGRTFTSLSPTLRIDFIMASPELEVRQFNRIIKPYSDHYMLLADVRFREK